MIRRFERPGSARGMPALAQALKAAVLWALGLVAALVAFHTFAVAQPQPWSGQMWFAYVADRLGLFLPFAAFAGGVTIWGRGPAAGRTGVAVLAGLVIGLASYALSEIVSPIADHAARAGDPDLAEIRPFGPRTPAGRLRELRFVEANPPEQYSPGDMARTQPNRVRLLLHIPLALVAFSVINSLLGLQASRLTASLRTPSRRNGRLAIGLAGGLAFFGAAVVASHPGRDWVVVSGVTAAWLPLAVPLLEAVAIGAIVRLRENAPVSGRLIGSLAPPFARNLKHVLSRYL